jgi:glycolate oxidase iron-sulfur subunit
VELHPAFAGTREGEAARELTSACVHCGFCLATCPTYLDGRDERDSPRGRIYLVKQMLETGTASNQTQLHLDRCLTCRSCETTCPSGMRYGELLDIGRELVEQRAPRPLPRRAWRRLLRWGLTSPRLFAAALRLGQGLRPLLPPILRRKVPPRQERRATPPPQHQRTVLLLEGCVQGAATPNTNDAVRRVLDRLGISVIDAPGASCCGAVNQHLAAPQAALADMRRNIDAWWPAVENGAEAIISSATGCGTQLRDYGRLLASDPSYGHKAQQVSGLSTDIGEILMREDLEKLDVQLLPGKVAVHVPCSLQHAMQLPDLIPTLLRRAGFDLATCAEGHLCCGSAGTYSILQPEISGRLRQRKLAALAADAPAVIATGNVGCQLHLGEAADIPVVHWIELLDRC